MRIETKLVYYADDGTVFDNEPACKKYEDDIKKRESATSYWIVVHSPDTTEGRGHFGTIYVEAYIPDQYIDSRTWMEDWCIKNYGRKLDFVQGVQAIEAWILRKIDRDKFLTGEAYSVGSYRPPAKRISLTVGKGDVGLLEVINDHKTK